MVMAPTMDEMTINEGEIGEPLPAGPGPDLERIETAIVQVLRAGEARAESLSAAEKREWQLFERMADGKAERDNPGDILSELGFYLAAIDKAREIFKAALMNDLIPDPARMDFFEGEAKWAGLEQYAEGITAMMRAKFKLMRPEDAENGFIQLLGMLIDDLTLKGTMIGLVTHEVSYNEHDAESMIESGPTLQYFDPFNVWPWRTDVNNFSQTAVTIYAPLTRADLESPENGYKNVEKVIESGSTAQRRRDPATGQSEQSAGFKDDLYGRRIYYGPWIGHQLREESGIDEEDESIWRAMAEEYGFDAEKARERYWWQIERVEEILIQCRPFPLSLPRGAGPLVAHKLVARNGRIWGRGMYHRSAWQERIINHFLRAMILTSAACADPPFTYREYLIDQQFLAERGGQVKLTSGEGIKITGDANAGKIIDPILFNAEAIPIMQRMADRQDEDIRELTGVTSAVEGTDRSKTATQSANNLQQSLSLIRYQEKNLEQGFLRQVVARCYVIQCQAMRLAGMTEHTAISKEQGQVQMVTVAPEMLIDETLIDWQMTGLTSPGNKMNLIQAFEKYAGALQQSGQAETTELYSYWGMLLGIPNADRFIAQGYDMLTIQNMLANLQTAFGQQGAMLLPDEAKKALAKLMMTGMVPGPGAAGGVGGVGGAGGAAGPGMPSQGPPVAGPTQPTGPAGLPMMGA